MGFSPVAPPTEHTTRNITCVEPQVFRPTQANTWEDFDLSKVVPSGATGALFHLINNDAGEARAFGLRKKGSTQDYHGSLKRHGHSWAMVGLDEDRKCQGYQEHLGVCHFLLVGYTGENYTFFTNGQDILPVTQSTWVDTDLSSYCPGAIGVIVEIANDFDYQVIWGLRKHGSTDDRHRAGRHCWAVVGLDSSQHLDIYYDDAFRPALAFNLIGYVTAGATFYTNADNIATTADGTYYTRSLASYLAEPVMAFIEVDSPFSTQDYAIRKNVWAPDIYYDTDNHNFAIVHPNTPDATIRVKLSNAAIGLYLLGIA